MMMMMMMMIISVRSPAVPSPLPSLSCHNSRLYHANIITITTLMWTSRNNCVIWPTPYSVWEGRYQKYIRYDIYTLLINSKLVNKNNGKNASIPPPNLWSTFFTECWHCTKISPALWETGICMNTHQFVYVSASVPLVRYYIRCL